MTSQITKDFKMKSRLRALADGGSPDPSILGSGQAARAGTMLADRRRQIDAAVDAANGAPAPAPQQVAQAPKKSGLRSLLGLADGGSYLGAGYNANRYQQSQLKDGGRVKGPGGRTDDKVGPVMLSDEEYVLPGDTADAIGRDKLDAIRLATHEFKDERKESALRGRADDVPVDHLADGGNPWIVDSKGTVRTNSFGDAAAGPGYQQARLPPPQPGTAVQVAQPPMGRRPPIDMGMADEVTRPQSALRTPATPNSRVFNAGKVVGRVADTVGRVVGSTALAAPLAGFGDYKADTGGIDTSAGGTLGYLAKGEFGNAGASLSGGAGEALADSGSGIAKTVDSVAALVGAEPDLTGKFDKMIKDKFGGYLTLRTPEESSSVETMRPPESAKGPVEAASPTSALRSDQGPANLVVPGSYQSRRLSEMGVPLDVQNSKPVVDSVTGNTRDFLRTGGTDKYQNLGTYGGDANIYGKADDPSRPGRINNFVGVGAGASPANEANGSGWDSTVKSALRGLGSGPSAPGGSNSGGGRVSVIGGEDRYDKLAKELRGMYSAKGQGNLAKKLVELEQLRANEQGDIRSNETSRANEQLRSETLMRNAQLSSETLMRNADVGARTNMLEALSRMEAARGSLTQQAQAAQRKAVEDARKTNEARDADSVKAYESVADTFAAGDKEKSKYYREVLSTLGPELDQIAQGLTPTDKRAFYTNILRQQVGRDEGLVLGRDVGATVQNAAIGGLIGGMSRLSNGAAGKAIDKALGKIPRVGPVISALRPAENISRFGTVLGAGAGAVMTPEIQEYNRFDPIARDPVSGAALPAREDLREALTHGAFDTYLNPFNDDVQTISGRRTNRPNPTEEEAARRYRSTLRTE